MAWKKARALVYRDNAIGDGLRATFAFMLDVAERLADDRAIYFPHQFDFRGRAYSLPLFLNPQGDDVCRGLLEFADARPVDDLGRWWLMVHLANCCGIDKIAFDGRVAWVESNMEKFRRWTEDPLAHDEWLRVDAPFQALAAAHAVCSDEAGQYLPVHVDGSNNALQHYAAALRCEHTRPLVNLEPRDA